MMFEHLIHSISGTQNPNKSFGFPVLDLIHPLNITYILNIT